MRFIVVLLVLTILGVFAILTFQPVSLELKELELKEQQKTEEANALRKENEELKKELHLLKHNKFYLEKFARENFGLSKTNELIFKFD
ncbi:septum formation initiator family protein [bacterium]|nr:septum formation initiator family protein [bacterium]